MARSCASGARARAETISGISIRPGRRSIRSFQTQAGNWNVSTTDRRKAAFLAVLSTRSTAASRVFLRRIAVTIPGTEVEPSLGVRRQHGKLRAVENVAAPEGRQGRLGHEVGVFRLLGEQADEPVQVVQRFTWNAQKNGRVRGAHAAGCS